MRQSGRSLEFVKAVVKRSGPIETVRVAWMGHCSKAVQGPLPASAVLQAAFHMKASHQSPKRAGKQTAGLDPFHDTEKVAIGLKLKSR